MFLFGPVLLAHAAQEAGRGFAAALRVPTWRALRDDRRGASAIVLALTLSSVLGVAGLAVDAGLWYKDKRSEQGVADLAAWTAMQTYYREGESSAAVSDAKNAAQAVAAMDGYGNGSGGVTVTVNNPPASGPNTGVPGAFEVIIAKSENLFLSSTNLNSVTVRGRAVAAVTTSTAGSGAPGCIFSMTTITLTGNTDIGASTCSIYANGAGADVITLTGNVDLTASNIYVVGTSISKSGNVTVSVPPVFSASPASNPYASDTIAAAETAASTEAAADAINGVQTGQSCPNTVNPATPTSKTLYPGYYCSGISISGNGSYSFSPGIYIIEGGGLQVTGNETLSGSGVTFVLTGGGSVNMSGNVNVNISAPTGGPTAGLAFFGDPNNTAAVNLSGNGSLTVNGAVYFPGQSVSFEGNTSNSNGCTQLVAYAITFVGNADFGQNCANSGTQQIGGTQTKVTMSMLE